MIYERLPDEIDYYACHGIRHDVLYSKTRYIFKTIRASTTILTTCRVVHSEVSSIIKNNIVAALANPAQINILEHTQWPSCPWRCPRRMFGELLLVIYWRWHILSDKTSGGFSMSTPDLRWREPRHCIERELEYHMWDITNGPARNTDCAKAITRLATRWPALEVVPDLSYKREEDGPREWCVLDLIRAMGEDQREMGREPVIRILLLMPGNHEDNYVPGLEYEGDMVRWAPECNMWYCECCGECWG
jgi:hypothetical protein